MGKKKKKEKVVYIDDGRTISDMSSVGGVGMFGEKKPRKTAPKQAPLRYRTSSRERWQTYTDAVKRMFVPMLVVLGAIILIYMILSLVFLFLA
jgi:uncharacterized membrane protein